MTQPTDKPGPGDSTPNFDWVQDPAADDTRTWQPPSGNDSATTLLPPDGAPHCEETERTDFIGPGDDVPPGAETPLEKTAPLFQVPPADDVIDEPIEEEPSEGARDDAGAASPFVPLQEADDAVEPAAVRVMPPARRAPARRSALLLVLLISYASAVTIALVYLYGRYREPNPHALESLPDLPPLEEGEVQIIPIDAPMPKGHTLRLGESQRFGNLRVEPLRVERGPGEFAHFTGEARKSRPATGPVLKLWLRFTNVSSDQAVAPLDPHLVFSRHFDSEGRTEAKNFVCRAADKAGRGPLVFAYDLPEASEWDFVGQQLSRVLQPGESFETYVPSAEEGLEILAGDLLWRVHFRKGYSPKGYGVTTLIEVAFGSDQIQSPPATRAAALAAR